MTITPLWMTGAELGAASLKEFDVVNSLTVSSASKKTGNYAFSFGNITEGNGYKNISSTTQFRVGMHISPGGVWGANNKDMIRVRPFTGSNAVSIFFDNANSRILSLAVRDVVKDTFPANPVFDTWQHWGLDFKADAVNGWAYFYIDGVLVMSFGGNTGTGSAERIVVGKTNSNMYTTYFDDIYIDDTTGQATPAPPPDKRFPFYSGLVDTATTQFTPSAGTDHAALLSDIPPVDAEYVEAGAAGLQELFTMPAITIPPGFSVAALWPVAQALKTDGGMDTRLKFYTKKATAAAVMGADLALPTSVGVVTERFAGAWLESEIEAGTFGFESAGAFA